MPPRPSSSRSRLGNPHSVSGSIRSPRKNFRSSGSSTKSFIASMVNRTLWWPSSNKGSPASKAASSRPPIHRAEETAAALIDYMTQSLESIEAMRSDLQKKFEEDLALSKKAEITLLEESNLRSNLERQRTLFNSVVDQLKQARLVSDYDSCVDANDRPDHCCRRPDDDDSALDPGVIVGVGLGSGVAFLADLLEARVRTLAEIRKLVDLPLIGVIPFIKDDQIVCRGDGRIAQPSEASIGTRGILQDDANQSRVSAA